MVWLRLLRMETVALRNVPNCPTAPVIVFKLRIIVSVPPFGDRLIRLMLNDMLVTPELKKSELGVVAV